MSVNTSCQGLINITRNRYLLGGLTEQRNKTLGGYTPGQGTLAMRYPLRGLQAGSVISAGLNTLYVWDVDSTSNIATVDGGYLGSIDAAIATDTPVRVNPRHHDFEIFNALNEELAALSAPGVGLFQMLTTQFPYNASRIGYDLPGVTNILSLYEVRYAENDQYLRTPQMPSTAYRLERSYLPGENTSGYSLKLYQGAQPGRNITVQYKAPFTPFATLTDDVSVTGISTPATDIPPMGAALRLGVGREVRRNLTESQGDTRRAEEVPAGAVGGSYKGIAATRMLRIGEEVERLQAAFPYRT